MADQEAVYDEEIAPALLKLRDLCASHNMPFLAVVGYGNGGSAGQTAFLPADARLYFRWSELLMNCWSESGGVNIDKFMFAVMEESRERGHGSLILSQLGVPPTGAVQMAEGESE